MLSHKLLAIDLDGTLLSSEKDISKKNKEGLDFLLSKGMRIVFASGRVPGGLLPYQKNLSKPDAVIAANGALALDHYGNVIHESTLSPKTIEDIIISTMHLKPYFHFYDFDGIYGEQMKYIMAFFNDFNKKLPQDEQISVNLLKDALNYVKKTNMYPYKLVFMDNDLDMIKRIEECILEISDVHSFKSEWNNLEVLPKGIHKGIALEKISLYYDIPLEQCIAIGNANNDIEMIEKAGIGLAVNNAMDDLKKVSDDVLSSTNDNDIIVELIEKYLSL